MKKENFSHPKFWHYWIVYGILTLISKLPYKILLNIGKFLGRISFFLMKKRKFITIKNLSICFPEYTDYEIESLAKKSFESLGMAVLETIISWFYSQVRLDKINTKIYGLDEYIKSRTKGKSIILYTSHSHCMDVAGRLSAKYFKNPTVVYQKNKNIFFEKIQSESRGLFSEQISRKDTQIIIKKLRRDDVTLWLAPDQNLGSEKNEFVDFFGQKCAIVSAVSRLPRLGKADVYFFNCKRNENFTGYEFYLEKVSENHITAEKYHKHIEKFILSAPEQYLWQHKRFKTQPEGFEDVYSK